MMKWITRLLLVALFAWSAYANSYNDQQNNATQLTYNRVSTSIGDQGSITHASASRALHTGKYALACQTEEGTYVPYMSNYVYSPVISIPAGGVVKFDLAVRGSFSDPDDDDHWGCQFQIGGEGTWYYISNPYADTTLFNYIYIDAPGDWSSFVDSYSLDGRLDDYAGMDIQFRLYFESDDDNPSGEGIFFDDVMLEVDGTVIYFEDFENNDMAGWVSVDATDIPSLWHQTTVGAYAGQSWAMNDPELGDAGGYLNHWYQTFDSPLVTLPTGQTNTVTFQQNRNIEALGGDAPWNGWDGTNMRISSDDGATWEVLTDVAPAYNATSMYSFGSEFNEGEGVPGWGGSSEGWEPVTVTIPSTYDGATVKIRFAFASDPGYDTDSQADMFGWIVDDIDIAGVLTNDGETSEGWVGASQVPLAGDLWHIGFVGILPVPVNVMAESDENEVLLTWAAPVTGATSEISYDNRAAWRWYTNADQPYGVIFEAIEDGGYLGKAKYYMSASGGTFAGTIDAYVYSIGVDGLPDQILYTKEGVKVAANSTATIVDLSGTGLMFNAGEKFALCIGNFAEGSQGLLADSISAENPASGNSLIWGDSGWERITDETSTELANLAIRAEIIIPEAGTSPTSFNVYRRLDISIYWDTLISDLTAFSYLDTDVINGEIYHYVVSANYTEGESEHSEEAIGQPESASVMELSQDDGSAEAGFNMPSAGDFQAVKFTPDGYHTLIKRMKIYSDDTDVGHTWAVIWDDNGPDGMPGTEIVRKGWGYLQPGWNTMDITEDSLWIDGGSIYFGIEEMASTPSIGADTDGALSGNSYAGLHDAGTLTWSTMSSLGLDYNLMFRIVVDVAFVVVGIDEMDKANLPDTYTLDQNYPNPFNPNTEISYSLPESGSVEVKIYDLSGREVDILVQEYQPAGFYKLRLDGSHMNSGIYIYTLDAGNVHLTRKMILLK